jgi:hypothetical protein
MQIHHIGDATVQKIWETDLNGMTFAQLLPGLAADARQAHPEWFPAGTADDDGHAFMSLHAWLVRHEGRVILVDAGAGNDKPRPQQMVLDRLSTAFLARLHEAGVEPEEVDFILLTHIHSDHVGWNTRLVKDRWVATFPNAQVIVSDLEYAYRLALTSRGGAGISAARARAGMGEPVRLPVSGTFADSIMPLAGQVLVRRVPVDGSEVLPGIVGGSVDEMALEIEAVVDVGVNGGELLKRSHLPEPQHGSLPSSKGQVAVLASVVGIAADLLLSIVAELGHRSLVGTQAIGRDRLR